MAFNAAHHRFDAIYSSDLVRALETARVLAQREGLEVKCLPQLRERHFGLFQGLPAAQGASGIPQLVARLFRAAACW